MSAKLTVISVFLKQCQKIQDCYDMGVWYFGENIKSVRNEEKLTFVSVFFSSVRKHKTDPMFRAVNGGDPRKVGIYNDTGCLSM